MSTAAHPAFSWYDVPADLKQLLTSAAQAWNDEAQSDALMHQVLNHPEVTMDVLVSAYRYFFYRHNDLMAQQLALEVMHRVRDQEGLPTQWEALRPILQEHLQVPAMRLYLTAYSALGLIVARLGDLEKASEIATRLQSIDSGNEFGASIILNILSPSEEEED